MGSTDVHTHNKANQQHRRADTDTHKHAQQTEATASPSESTGSHVFQLSPLHNTIGPVDHVHAFPFMQRRDLPQRHRVIDRYRDRKRERGREEGRV